MGIWDHQLWLPNNSTWNDLTSTASVRFPSTDDLKFTIVLGAAMLVFRILVESFIFVPIGWLGGWVKEPVGTRIIQHLCGGFMGKSKLKKASECGFRFCYYIVAFFCGMYVLWNEPQFTDVTECWRNWPKHPLPNHVYWYYMIETGFYWALLISTCFLDIRRHDFFQMLLHHAITICLLWISWTMNMVRVGTLVLFSHDAADIFIELAKLLRYANWQLPLTITFVVLLIVWTATRLVYYPFWIIQSIVYDAPALIQQNYSWANLTQQPIVPRILMVMLCLLLVLHIFWTTLLVNVLITVSTKKGEIDDIREESSDDEEEEDITSHKKEE